MDKLNYLAKTLSRTNRKDFENFAINTIWNRLGRSDIQPVSQQYVRNHENGRRFIDLYFPQLNIGIECDEKYHLGQKELDRQREIELIDILTAINADSYAPYHVRIYGGYETAMRDIDVAVAALREKIRTLEDEGTLEPWNPELGARELLADREDITVLDNIVFDSIKDACNILFGSHYEGMQMAFFVPRGAFRNRFEGRHIAWFPKISVEGSTTKGWKNLLEGDGSRLLERNIDGRRLPRNETTRRVIIPHIYDPVLRTRGYRFMGVFELDGFTKQRNEEFRVWKRVDEIFPILKDMPTAKPSKKMLASIDKCMGMFEGLEECYENEVKINDVIVSLCERSKWQMDCEHAFSQLTFDGSRLEDALASVNDIGVLGSGVYSRWRYITHWSYNENLLDEKNRCWFLLVLNRLRELVQRDI